MSEPYLGQVSMFGGNYAPRGYAFCNGQLLSISQYSALFSLLGTYYGGNGVTNFALPNLQSRLPVHTGTGPGLSDYPIGQAGGTPSVTINMTTMPTHNHGLNATLQPADDAKISASVIPGTITTPNDFFYASQGSGEPALTPHTMANEACSINGGGQAHSNLMPSLCITFIIALQGIYPSRN